MTSESSILAEIRRECSRANVRLFRNNVGVLRDKNNRPVRFGLHPGSGDLIGWKVEAGIARFVSIEVKAPGKDFRTTQRSWHEAVLYGGGISGIAHSVEEAKEILELGYSPRPIFIDL